MASVISPGMLIMHNFIFLPWLLLLSRAYAGEISDAGIVKGSMVYLFISLSYFPVCGSIMEPRSEQGTKHGSSAWHATANHPECSKNYEWNPGAYGRDRMADYNLKCRVSLLRVHVRNSNKMCDGNNRCALKKFDILSEEAGWAYIGRFMMPDPGTTVGLKLLTNFTEIFRTVAVFHSRLSLSIWMETESHTRQNTLHLWLVVTRPTMENQWNRTTMQVQLSARSSLRPQLVSGNV